MNRDFRFYLDQTFKTVLPQYVKSHLTVNLSPMACMAACNCRRRLPLSAPLASATVFCAAPDLPSWRSASLLVGIANITRKKGRSEWKYCTDEEHLRLRRSTKHFHQRSSDVICHQITSVSTSLYETLLRVLALFRVHPTVTTRNGRELLLITTKLTNTPLSTGRQAPLSYRGRMSNQHVLLDDEPGWHKVNRRVERTFLL